MLEVVGVVLVLLGFAIIVYGFLSGVEGDGWRSEEERELLRDGLRSERTENIEEEEKERRTEITGGGVVLIGPIPIVFGNSRYAVLALVLSILLMVVVLTIMILGFVYGS